MTCRYSRDLGQRVLPSRHADDCTGNCDGCQPCTQRHCGVGKCWNHCDDANPQTCTECVGAVRDDLAEILRLYERLPWQAIDGGSEGHLLADAPIPGGDPLVLLAPASDGRARAWARERGDQREAQGQPRGLDGDTSHAQDESNADPVPPLLLLATWEDDWRIELGHDPGPTATIWRCVDYLAQQLTMMAQRHLAFADFAADIAACRARLEDAVVDGERDEHGAPCQKCGTLLVRRAVLRKARRYCPGHGPFPHCSWPPTGCCDTGGLEDVWRCPTCGRTYTAAEYWKAVERDYQDNANALHGDAIERRTGVLLGTVRVWAHRGKVRIRGKDERGRVLYDVADVERHAEGGAA